MPMQLGKAFTRFFPVPSFLVPPATGVDITDASIKWISLGATPTGVRVVSYGQLPLESGVVEGGVVKNPRALSEHLREVRAKSKRKVAHVSLPEEGAYVFSMHASGGRKEVTSAVEFELEGRVPIPLAEAVFDYERIMQHADGSAEISVTAFDHGLAEGYVEAFERAAFPLMSMEVEARSIARAVLRSSDEPTTLLVDIGKKRTGIAIVKRGVPIFTSTVEVGGAQMSEVVMSTLALSEVDAEQFKNEHGLVAAAPEHKATREALEKAGAALADEVARHFHFWDTRRNEAGERVTPVERVYLVGGSANLKGIADFIAGKVHARTERPNVWHNVASFDDYIPPITRRESLQFATAIGLALRDHISL